MKNRLNVLMITALMAISTGVFANREPDVNVISKGESKLVMKLFTHEETANIRIRDEKGFLLYSEKTNETSYLKIFDMTTLPEGAYTIEVEGERTIQIIYFQVNEGKTLVKSNPGTIYKPVITQKGTMANLQLMNLLKEDVKVSFYNRNGDLLLKHTPENDIRVEKRFSLAELQPGNYVMMVTVGGRVYQKNLAIN